MGSLRFSEYYVSVLESKLICKETKEDLSNFVRDFNLFSKLGVNIDGDVVSLVHGPLGRAVFVRYPCASDCIPLDVGDVINLDSESISVAY